MNGLEALFSLATEVTKLTLALGDSSRSSVLFGTRPLPWGWSGAIETSAPYLDLRGPFGSKLFVTAENEQTMRELREAQELILGIHFPSIVLSGRSGVGGGGSHDGYYVKWTSIPSRKSGLHLVFFFQTRQARAAAEESFQRIVDCVDFVEMLPSKFT